MKNNILRPSWARSGRGYKFVEIDPDTVDWGSAKQTNAWSVTPPPGSQPEVAAAIKKWGKRLEPTAAAPKGQIERDTFPFKILEPIGGSMPVALKPFLYLEFARLTPTHDEIVKFANKYGCLRPDNGPDAEPSFWWQWQKEIKRLKTALRACTKYGKSAKHLRRLLGAINSELATKASSLDNSSSIMPVLELGRGGVPSLVLQPKNLTTALWLQLIHDLAGGKQFAKCSECDAIMLITPGVNRPDRKTCGTRCRKRASRKRLKQKTMRGRRGT